MYKWIIYYIKSKTNQRQLKDQPLAPPFPKVEKDQPKDKSKTNQRQPKDQPLAPPFLTSYERWIWLRRTFLQGGV